MTRIIAHCPACNTDTIRNRVGECPWPHEYEPSGTTDKLDDDTVAAMHAWYEQGLTMLEVVAAFPDALPFAQRYAAIVVTREFRNRGLYIRSRSEARLLSHARKALACP